MEEKYKFVDFEKWCPLCKHKNIAMNDDPCDYCLETPARPETTKPERFEENSRKIQSI